MERNERQIAVTPIVTLASLPSWFNPEGLVPAQLGYSTLAFALDGFTVFAPSLQSTFQLSLAVLVSYRFCGHI